MNRKSSEHKDRIPEWYRLDNAGKIFPAIISRRMTSLFRLSVTLKRPVQVALLQKALEQMMDRCPYFNVRLKAGLFWYFYERNHRSPHISPDSRHPCMNYNIKRGRKHLFRVVPYRNRIAVEFSHGLTDGTGALLFLKSLTAAYLELNGINSDDREGLLVPGTLPDPAEIEDGFKKHYRKEIPSPPSTGKAFHLPEHLLPAGHYRITTGIMPSAKLLESSRALGCTITEYLAAMLMESYQEYFNQMPDKLKKKTGAPVILRIPVNLRRMFPSPTMLNFFLAFNAEIDPRLGEYSFDEILKNIKAKMATCVDPKVISQQIARNVRGELSLATKLMPLLFKNLILKLVYRKMGDNKISCSLSNMGRVSMPEAYRDQIERFEFIPPPTLLNRINCSVISWEDRLYFSFGNLGKRPAIETLFFRKLVRAGIPVRIESNYQEIVCPTVQDAE